VGARFDLTRLGGIVEISRSGCSVVIIECLPWREFIAERQQLF
jgi:hypothetical protein